MKKYFGTDGIRGKFGNELGFDLAYKLGYIFANEFKNIKILIGRDTRFSGHFLSLAFSCGAMQCGAKIVDVGICPTAGISFLTKKLGFDYGVVISASHNPAEYNGIKIFDSKGLKLSDDKENLLEQKLLQNIKINFSQIGEYELNLSLLDEYTNYLSSTFDFCFYGKKLVLDCANGSTSKIADKIFRDKGAEVILIGASPNGKNINQECGCVNIENLRQGVLKNNADLGFAFDGDGDRLIVVDKSGAVVDGDKIVYIFSCYLKEQGKLKNQVVVGTKHTNMGVEIALKNRGIKLIRTDIGDKFVGRKIRGVGAVLGGEQSGHIILNEIMPTGDGNLSALFLSFILMTENKTISSYLDFEDFCQVNINIEVSDKNEIIKNKQLCDFLKEKESVLNDFGRVLIRASGTESCIRIMVETQSESVSKKIANEFAEVIQQIDGKLKKCVE